MASTAPLLTLRRVGRSLAREQRVLLLAVLSMLLAAGFGKLASEMLEGETGAFDRTLTFLFRAPTDYADPIGPAWLPAAIIDLTALGSVAVLTLITLLVVGFLLLRRRWRQALFVAASIAGGMMAGKILKAIFARPRPELVPHLVDVTTLSFPSGHATYSAVVYLTLAMLLARSFKERRLRLFILGAGLLLTGLIGLTRVYLGVHYPSDVIAGWTAGAAWALAMSLLARLLQSRRSLEPPT